MAGFRFSGATIMTGAVVVSAAMVVGAYAYAGYSTPHTGRPLDSVAADPSALSLPPTTGAAPAQTRPPTGSAPADATTEAATATPAATKGATKATATTAATTRATTKAATVWTTVTVAGTRVLNPGESWSSNRLRFTLGTDGNVTLADQGHQVWTTGTAGRGGIRVVMQGDGNLVLYDGGSNTVWSTRTDGHPGAVLVLGADGTLRIVDAGTTLWSA